MVVEQLIARGITNDKVLAAFRKVPRHEFVSDDLKDEAYGDYPLSIGAGQTISQPYMVALMTEYLGLKGGERVLEVGTGSGYQAAILAEISKEVFSIERHADLTDSARSVLERLGYRNIWVKTGDGTQGWADHAPYDGIIVTAGSPDIPKNLLGQLSNGGRLVIPVGGELSQVLTVVERNGGAFQAKHICGCVFVPLIGKDGWAE